MSDISQIWDFMQWGFGICITGFLFLAGWMWWLVGKIKIKEDFMCKMDTMCITLKSIEVALIGDFDKKGIITRLNEIEKNCERFHSVK